MTKAKVAVLISGAGTNMAALLYAAKAADCPYELVFVGSNDPDALGLKIAEAEGIATWSLSHKGMNRDAFDALVDEQLRSADTEFVALAGYMRILSDEFVGRWAGKMVNIHPSLLPLYKGLNTHQQAIEAGDKFGGCSVHIVTSGVDDGPVLAQTPVAILPDDTVETLARRVQFAEHQLYPATLAAFVTRERSPDYLRGRVRELAMELPEADEVMSHGMPCFGIVKGKKFAYFTEDHHGDGKIALLVKISGGDEQAALIELDEDRYYRPAYFGDGWVGIRLDLGDTDWDAIGEWLRKSWLAVAPKKLAGLMGVAEDF
ncbi:MULTISPECIES: phosphoribosylglycinamide formyltransferase [unclassified Sphingopyxis]|uniref:phosphoribosylglycinamide formyltransferase n=1 Tax=unclassified Sphingopyxis TaxID=2614943 RepID=UPI0006C3CED0|nr:MULTISPECIES: phosphoribosylglycinamide formyltransferase [unclassified Sphingopyxis]USI75522.1 phosphoribosylglycinamide formyltransferase [Sphingopyxis sp. USTB-05]GAO77971.1 phosphoribosylglycinamide formyltransferase [Sphingopyxis sp. C-1]